MLPLLSLLLACWIPRETGPTTMVGHVVDASGAPLAGVDVETVEGRQLTNEEGRFGVHYKDPSQWVTFLHEGVRFRRFYRPADDRVDVRLQVPPLTRRDVACEALPDCRARLVWPLDEAFRAEVDVSCDAPGEPPPVSTPEGPPHEVTCRTSTSAEPVPAEAVERDGMLVIRPSAAPVTVELFTRQRPEPSACEVRADGVPLTLDQEGLYAAALSGIVTFTAWCDGVPATPVRAAISGPAALEIEWTRATPRLDLRPHAPWAERLLLTPVEAQGSSGWVLELPVGPEGTFPLPPLGPGTYALVANLGAEELPAFGRDGALAPGTLYAVEVRAHGVEPEHPGVHGILRVGPRQGDAPVRVDWTARPAAPEGE